MRLDRMLWSAAAATVLFLGAEAALAAAPDPKAPARRELRRRTLVIDDQTLGSLPELHVAGGSATILTFEIPVQPNGALIMDTRELFLPPTQSEKTVVLVPKVDLARPVALSVALTDGTVLSFKLATVPREADVQVDVIVALKSRASPGSAEALRTTIEQLRGELDDCRATSASAGASKLASLLLGQNLDEPQVFDRHSLRGADKQNRLLVEARWVYRLVGLTYLVFTVENRDPAKPWVLDRAEVKRTGAGDALDLRVLTTATDVQLLAPGQGSKVVVAFQTPPQSAAHRYTVTFLERAGGRRVVLEGLSP